MYKTTNPERIETKICNQTVDLMSGMPCPRVENCVENAGFLKFCVCVSGSGRKAADVHQQHAKHWIPNRYLCGLYRCHSTVVPGGTSSHRCRVRDGLRRLLGWRPSTTTLPVGINGSAVDARRRHCPRTE